MRSAELVSGQYYMIGKQGRKVDHSARLYMALSTDMVTLHCQTLPEGGDRNTIGAAVGKPGVRINSFDGRNSQTAGIPMIGFGPYSREQEMVRHLTGPIVDALDAPPSFAVVKLLAPAIYRALAAMFDHGARVELPEKALSATMDYPSPDHLGETKTVRAYLQIVAPRSILCTATEYGRQVREEFQRTENARYDDGLSSARATQIGHDFAALGVNVFATPAGVRLSLDEAQRILDRLHELSRVTP